MNKLLKSALLALTVAGGVFGLAACKQDEGIDLDNTNKPNEELPDDEDLDDMEEEKVYTAVELWTEALKNYEAETDISRNSFTKWHVTDAKYLGKPVDVKFNINYTDYLNDNKYFREEIVLGSFNMTFGDMAPAHEYKKFYYDGVNDVYSVYEYKSQSKVKKGEYLPGATADDPWTVTIDTPYEQKWIGDQYDGLEFDKTLASYKALPGFDLAKEENFNEVPEVKKDEETKMYYFEVTLNKDNLLEKHPEVGTRLDPKCELETIVFTQDTTVKVGIDYDLNLKTISFNEACSGKFLAQKVQANTTIETTLSFTYGDDALMNDEIIDADLLPQAETVAFVNRKEEE